MEYIRGSDYGGGIGGILYTLRNGNPSYNHYNSRGDVIAKTDDNSSLTYQAAYEAFGKHSDALGTQEWGDNSDRQQANTKDEDPTGLLNEGFRYRDLETGTFITRDPLGFVDGPNVYTYVVQNPWTKFDPLGLKAAIDDPNFGKALSENLAPADNLINKQLGNRVAGVVDNTLMGVPSAITGPTEITESEEFQQTKKVAEKAELAMGPAAIIKNIAKKTVKEGVEAGADAGSTVIGKKATDQVGDKTAKEISEESTKRGGTMTEPPKQSGSKKATDSSKNEKHGDGGKALSKAEKQIQELKQKLESATKKNEKKKIQQKIKNIQDAARRAKKGEEHSRTKKR